MRCRWTGAAAAIFAAAVLPGLTAAGCAQGTRLAESTWQVTAIYTDPEAPAAVPEPAAGLAVVSFGASSLTGVSGCSPIQAGARFSDDAANPASPDKATSVELTAVEIAQPADDCIGPARHVHDELVAVLTPGEFTIDRVGDAELVLTHNRGQVDAPAIRLAAS